MPSRVWIGQILSFSARRRFWKTYASRPIPHGLSVNRLSRASFGAKCPDLEQGQNRVVSAFEIAFDLE